jgi:FkbM family methyltransferase
VFTFEFTPDNLEVLNKNFDLNPELSKRIEVVPKALWENSNEVITYRADGPATSIALREQTQQDVLNVSTVSIDDIVKEKKMPRVDYIKMDIEGAELGALKGAEETLRAFKPKLAIAVYHRDRDMIEIPAYLNGLGLGYEFFLDHFTIYGAETVLFATPKS